MVGQLLISALHQFELVLQSEPSYFEVSYWAHTYRHQYLQESNHPFVTAMVDFLVESGQRANRPAIVNAMMRGTTAKYEQDIKTMAELADESEIPASR